MKHTLAILTAFLLCLALGAVAGYKLHPSEKITYHSDTITKIRIDTIRVSQTCTITKWKTKTDTAYLRIIDTLRQFDTLRVEVPIYKYITSLAGGYTIYHKGYKSVIDSIKAPKTTITQTIKHKPQRFGIGVYAGAGINHKGEFQPQIGLGLTYTIFYIK